MRALASRIRAFVRLAWGGALAVSAVLVAGCDDETESPEPSTTAPTSVATLTEPPHVTDWGTVEEYVPTTWMPGSQPTDVPTPPFGGPTTTQESPTSTTTDNGPPPIEPGATEGE